jgi:hypothetical protein
VSCTIGGHAQKILNTLQEKSYYFKNDLKFINDDIEKHDHLMKNFKRGGISHCGQKGKHNKGVMSIDICSQYPAAMKHMEIPSGNSEWTKEYDVTKYGYYLIKNVAFDKTKTYDFKPVCLAVKSDSFNWKTGSTIEDLYITSYDIICLKANYGHVSFDVVEGLVSNYSVESTKIFGVYVDSLFQEKAKQDAYKSTDDILYNPAYRETIELYLNAVTRKLVMDRAKYNSVEFVNDDMIAKRAKKYEDRLNIPTSSTGLSDDEIKELEVLTDIKTKYDNAVDAFEKTKSIMGPEEQIKNQKYINNLDKQYCKTCEMLLDNRIASDEDVVSNKYLKEVQEVKLPTKSINGNTFYVKAKTADKSQNIWINAGCMV